MENNVPFDILCGECHVKMSVYNEKQSYLWCEICKRKINAEFLRNFLCEKYEGKIKYIEVTNSYSAKIFFYDSTR